MGGSHDCDQSFEQEPRLQVILPDPPRHYVCGNHYRSRLDQDIVIDGAELTHLTRFFERVDNDEEASELRVAVRHGTLQFFGAAWIYSAQVGYSDDD